MFFASTLVILLVCSMVHGAVGVRVLQKQSPSNICMLFFVLPCIGNGYVIAMFCFQLMAYYFSSTVEPLRKMLLNANNYI